MDYELLDQEEELGLLLRKIEQRRRSPRPYVFLVVVAVVCIVLASKSLVLSTRPNTILLSASPTLLEDGGDLIITWHNTTEMTMHSQDYLTLSCGPQRDADDYLVKKSVLEVDATPNSVRFSALYMMRCVYTVQYFACHQWTGVCQRAGSIQVPVRESINTPKHGHLALTTDENAMAIMFNSASNRTPEVRYGLDRRELGQHRQGISTTYKATDMCQAPATTVAQNLFRDPGYMHTVIMKDLVPNTQYYYQYGNNEDGWSSIRHFRSRPLARNTTTRFIAYADMGVNEAPAGYSNAVRVYSSVVEKGYDSFLLHFGDISYARGEGSVWDKFFHLIEPYATRLPYMVSIGNHEYDYTEGGENDPSGGAGLFNNGFHPSWGNYGKDSLGECAVPMHHRWHAPATGNFIYWYSFNYGSVHVIQMSSEHDWTRRSVQYQWLEQDLASVDRTATPWIVLTSHRMMYSTQLGMDSDMLVAVHFREEIEPLLYQYRVNLMLVGHQHAYERSCAVYRGECVADTKSGTVHIVAGAAGYGLDSTDFSTKYGNWSLVHVNEYGHLRVATTEKDMHIQFVLNRNGAVFDEVTLQQW